MSYPNWSTETLVIVKQFICKSNILNFCGILKNCLGTHVTSALLHELTMYAIAYTFIWQFEHYWRNKHLQHSLVSLLSQRVNGCRCKLFIIIFARRVTWNYAYCLFKEFQSMKKPVLFDGITRICENCEICCFQVKQSKIYFSTYGYISILNKNNGNMRAKLLCLKPPHTRLHQLHYLWRLNNNFTMDHEKRQYLKICKSSLVILQRYYRHITTCLLSLS